MLRLRYLVVSIACASFSGLLLGLMFARSDGGFPFASNTTQPHFVFTTGGLHLVLLVLGVAGTVIATLAHVRMRKQNAAQQIQTLQSKLAESEERFRQAQKMEAMGQLAGGIAHDFNNLVTVIRCSVSLLDECLTSDNPGVEELNQIKHATERASALTRQLLAFSRRQTLTPRPLDLNVVIRDLVNMLGRILGAHVKIHTYLQYDIPHIIADVGQMEQVIVNLAVNARDAIPATGGSITFTTGIRTLETPEAYGPTVVPAGRYVTFVVRDTGKGMDSEVLSRAFEPFFTTKSQGNGTGLGLAIVQGIIYQSGGYIGIESMSNTGTTVTLYFPTPLDLQQTLVTTRQD